MLFFVSEVFRETDREVFAFAAVQMYIILKAIAADSSLHTTSCVLSVIAEKGLVCPVIVSFCEERDLKGFPEE